MNFLWQLVLLTVVTAGVSDGNDIETIVDLHSEENRHSSLESSTRFQCFNKPPGYYADPRFECKVFHYCRHDGTRTTISCGQERHNICLFKDITSSACEGSEIYLALPQDLELTTTSEINGATDFWLPKVLPEPTDTNLSTTPLSLEFKKSRNPKEMESIFEVFNSVLREIQADKGSSDFKIKPSVFSRGSSKFQASPIRRDDFPIDQAASLVEVNKGKNEKLLDEFSSVKKSKNLFFLPKLIKKVPGDHPRRKKRTVVESRPYAVIYAKVPEAGRTNQRKDIIEVPFVAARVPADVPTVPITIETRRKKKSKSKKKNKNVPQTFYMAEADREQTSEQQNVLYFSPEQIPGLGPHDPRGRSVTENRHRPRQNSALSSTQTQPPQSNTQSAYQQPPQSSQNPNPFHLPNFPFQTPADSAPPDHYFENRGLHPFPLYGFPDQFMLAPQLEAFQRERDRKPNDAMHVRPPNRNAKIVRQPPNSRLPRVRQTGPQTQSIENAPQQVAGRSPQSTTSAPSVRQQSAVRLQMHQPESRQVRHQTLRQPETVIPHSVRQQQLIQAQPIRQLKDVRFENTQPIHGFDPTTQSASAAQFPGNSPQNTQTPDQDGRGRLQTIPPSQIFPDFNSPFFQGFPGFGTFPFNEPFSQPGPHPHDLRPPHGSQYQGQPVPPQDADDQRKPHQLRNLVHLERPSEQHFPRTEQPQPAIAPPDQVHQNLGRPREFPSPQLIPGRRPEDGMVYVPEHARNPNLIEAERSKPGSRPTLAEGHVLVAVPQPPRHRSRPATHAEAENHRNRGQPQHQNYREPNSNRVQERPRVQNSRRPSDHSQPQTAAPNEMRQRVPSSSTAGFPDIRIQHSTQPQDIRDEHSDLYSQRQPTRHRIKQNQVVNSNEQRVPQYETYRHITTTPLPRKRERPSLESFHEPYNRDQIPQNEESMTTVNDERPFHRYRSSSQPHERSRVTDYPYERTSTTPHQRTRTTVEPKRRLVTPHPQYERPRTPENLRISSQPQHHQLPVTSRYFVTSPPRFRPPEEEHLPPYLHSEENLRAPYERPRVRPETNVERAPPPPAEYLNAESLPEHPRPHRHNSYNSQHGPSDLNVVSKNHDDRPQKPENVRPRHRDTSYRKENHTPEIENGFLPVSDKPYRNYFYSTRAPENVPPYEHREPDQDRLRSRLQGHRERVPTTRVTTTPKPTKKRKPPPRPTFPAFPTFPPPPRRITTTPRPTTTEEIPEDFRSHVTEYQDIRTTTVEPVQRSRYREDFRTEVSVSRHVATESDLQTDSPEVTTKRRTRKRRPKRPRTTTLSYDDDDGEDVDAVTQATTRREFTSRSTPRTTRSTTVRPLPSTTRSTPSNYNRWRQQTTQRKLTTTPVADPSPATETPKKSEEYGSRLNLFGRPRTRKPTSFAPKPTTTTPTSPLDQEHKTSVGPTRRHYVKKVRKKVTTPDPSDPIARSDEDEDTLQFVSDLNSLHGVESITRLSVQNLDLETTTVPSSEAESSAPRILKFGKPRLRSTLNISVGGSQ